MTQPLTRKEIEALLDGITPGEWEAGESPNRKYMSSVKSGCFTVALVGASDLDEQNDNCIFIAAAPTLARQLLATLDELAELKRENERLREAMWQLLDDMGPDDYSVCPAAKEQALCVYSGIDYMDEDSKHRASVSALAAYLDQLQSASREFYGEQALSPQPEPAEGVV